MEGGDRVVSLLHNLGVTATIQSPAGVATTLGPDAISMAEHLAAYSAFDNGGYRIGPHAVLKVTDPTGQVLESFDPAPRRPQGITPQLRHLLPDLPHRPLSLHLAALAGTP